MEANEFVAAIKADGSAKDLCDLDQVYRDYTSILAYLPTKDRGPFSLNVLCILCRNLDKVATWSAKVDTRALLTLSIDCVRETRCLFKPDRVKTLACVYHIHRHITRQKNPPPEMVLKISYMPFDTDTDSLLSEYCKTYWNLLVDRVSYIDKLKANRVAIMKLLTKLIEDVEKIIHMYDSVQFCCNVLLFLLKKLHFLYNDVNPSELNKAYGRIFENLSKKKDMKMFKKLSATESLDLYVKLNDCLYAIADNSTKIHFKENILSNVVRTCISILHHCPDFFHCLQTFYSNSFCNLLSAQMNSTYIETVLNNLVVSFETTEKLGYRNAMTAMYPFLNRLLRLFIEYVVNNPERIALTDTIQECCLKLMLFFMDKLKTGEQLMKCENCKVKSALHDALHATFLTRHFISTSLSQKLDTSKILPTYLSVIREQESSLRELGRMGCPNYEKFYKKFQADIHNTAIALNKAHYYEYSIRMFELYLRNEIRNFKNDTELKNISRALFNKSICELDYQQYETALHDAHMSLIFTYPESLKSEKYMSLVMDVKAKALKAKNDEDIIQDDENQDDLQLTTVLNSCIRAAENSDYGNLKPFLCNLKFSVLLRHEFDMYCKLWPSIVPVAGVWRSLHDLTKEKPTWLKVQDDALVDTLYGVVLETAVAVRTIHSDYYATIVARLLDAYDQRDESLQSGVIRASLLFLQSEFDLAEAGQKHGWKITEPNTDPDQMPSARTAPQEHRAAACALRALGEWTRLVPHLRTLPTSACLRHALQIAQVSAQQLLHLQLSAPGLQLAWVCCQLALHLDQPATFVHNASTILSYALHQSAAVDELLSAAARHCGALCRAEATLETALVFLCDCAMYYARCGSPALAARLAQTCQARVLRAYEAYPQLNLDLAVGRLLEAQGALCRGGPSALSAVNGAQRHYLSSRNNATKWAARRCRALALKRHMTRSGAAAAAAARALLAPRRARAAAAAALPAASALGHAGLFASITNTYAFEDAQTKIDNRLKHILGLQPSNETQPNCKEIQLKTEPFVPKPEIETMLKNMTLKKTQVSPSVPCISVPSFKTPEFLTHDNACQCYACQNPLCQVLACQISFLEASMYFRAKEFDIAKNYFDGAIRCFQLCEKKIDWIVKRYRDVYEGCVVDIVEKSIGSQLKRVQIEGLIEFAFYELACEDFQTADKTIVWIHEILEEAGETDAYLRNEVLNLMTASAQLKNVVQKPIDIELEAEIEGLKLSPTKDIATQRTPETKTQKPPILPKVIVTDEEIPNTKRRPIKLDLDQDLSADENTKKRISNRTAFKIPVPVTTKHELESLTPRTRPKKTIPASEDTGSIFDIATPKPKDEKVEFFTPMQTPSEQFFTPISTMRTYAKKSLRHGIVKNLEHEFMTPKAVNKENHPIVEETVSELAALTKTEIQNNQKVATKDVEMKPNRSSRSLKPPTNFNTKSKVENNSEITRPKSLSTKLGQGAEPSLLDIPNRPNAKSLGKSAQSNSNTKVTEKCDQKSAGPSLLDINRPNAKTLGGKSARINSDTKVTEKCDQKSESLIPGRSKETVVKRTLKRATSPGKIVEKEPLPRSTRLRKPIRFSSEEGK